MVESQQKHELDFELFVIDHYRFQGIVHHYRRQLHDDCFLLMSSCKRMQYLYHLQLTEFPTTRGEHFLLLPKNVTCQLYCNEVLVW
jgi:hypothetical protein